MYDREISHRQLTAWLAAALIPTVIQLTAATSWISVMLAGVLCLLCIWIRWMFGGSPDGKLISVLQWGVLVVVIGIACRESVLSWPRGGHPITAVILLALAVWSVSKGTSASARVGCVLFWFVLLLYLVLLGAGVKDVQTRWLKPTTGDVSAFGCILLLTPAAASIHLNKKESIKPRLVLIVAFAILAAAVTGGVLSPQVALQKENAFYEMTRSLSLLGQARRFEALLSAGATASWFSLLSLYLSLCAQYAERFHTGWGKWGSRSAALVAAIWLLCEMHIPGIVPLILAAIFWVLIPLLTQGLGREKKS